MSDKAEACEPMSALGQKQTHAVQQRMSALPPIATEKADIAGLLDHLVGTAEKRDWEGDTERLCGFEIEGQFNLRCLHDW